MSMKTQNGLKMTWLGQKSKIFDATFIDPFTKCYNEKALELVDFEYVARVKLFKGRYTWEPLELQGAMFELALELVTQFGHDQVFRSSAITFVVISQNLTDLNDKLFAMSENQLGFVHGVGKTKTEADNNCRINQTVRLRDFG